MPTEFYLEKEHAREAAEMSAKEVRDELRVARTRLMLASAFVDFMRFAYAALLTSGVNYQNLKAYKDTTILDDAAKLPLIKGSDRYLEWIGRVRHDITAAVARGKLKAVFTRKSPPPRNPKDKA
jgi:hypothetical protein